MPLSTAFSVRYMSSPVRLSVVCRLSVTLVRPTHFVQIFGNISTTLGTFNYLGHLLTLNENFTEIVPGDPLRRGS